MTDLSLASRPVRRIGFGAMQLPGPGVFGPPKDPETALAVLRRAVELGVNHIDTAQYYGPDVSNDLIHRALHPYPADLVIVSKVGARRDEAGGWLPAGSPAELRAGVEANLRSLALDRVDVVNLRVHAPAEPDARFEAQLDTMAGLREEGLIGGVGISNVSEAQLRRAAELTEVACVQNPYNLVDRASARVLAACEELRIAFVPFFPMGSGFPGANRVLDHPALVSTAARLGAEPGQVALAWLLAHSPWLLLIPGTSSLAHLEENLAAGDLALDAVALATLDAAAP